MISEEKVLFLTQLILTKKKEVLELERCVNEENEKEFLRTRENLNKICLEINDLLNSFRKESVQNE
jgi:hypothetical protein